MWLHELSRFEALQRPLKFRQSLKLEFDDLVLILHAQPFAPLGQDQDLIDGALTDSQSAEVELSFTTNLHF